MYGKYVRRNKLRVSAIWNIGRTGRYFQGIEIIIKRTINLTT